MWKWWIGGFILSVVTVIVAVPACGQSGDHRQERRKRLQELTMAMHKYHVDFQRIPKQAFYSRQGKPLHSWRVELLVYLGLGNLEQQFKLGEPWDSPANKRLLAKMPDVFKVPGTEAPEGKTYYQVFVAPERTPAGKTDRFQPPFRLSNAFKVSLGQLTVQDGTSNTLCIVEAATPVEWTKPEDLLIEHDEASLPKLGCVKGEPDFGASFIYGGVCFLRRELPDRDQHARLLRQMIGYRDAQLLDTTPIITEDHRPELGAPTEGIPAKQERAPRNDRERRLKNLRDLVLGMHNYHEALAKLPTAIMFSKDNKPLLSWRVTLLPYLGQEELFKQFKLDEPWDSEHNKKLVGKMPSVFKVPGAKDPGAGMTYLQVFTAPNAIPPGKDVFRPAFRTDPTRGLTLGQLTVQDGTSNTLAIAESAKAVVWTKPEDMVIKDDTAPLPVLGCVEGEDDFVGVFFDGAARFIRRRSTFKDKTEFDKLMRQIIGHKDGVNTDVTPLLK